MIGLLARLLTVVALAAAVPAFAAAPVIGAIGVESQYADIIRQVGGRFVAVRAIENDPGTDPHDFEASPSIARAAVGAQLVVENGLGYDSWADKILAAAPNPARRVVNVQHLLGLPDATPNPHLWYDPRAMPAVAAAVAADLAALQPDNAADFHARATAFEASLARWMQAMAAFKARHPATAFAVTEPVGDYLLQAMGGKILTPPGLEAAIMNGTDPAPQEVAVQLGLLRRHAVAALVYNRQVTDALTQSFLAAAKQAGIPVVGVYETMPTPGFTYQSWMLAEVQALERAVSDHASTEVLRAQP